MMAALSLQSALVLLVLVCMWHSVVLASSLHSNETEVPMGLKMLRAALKAVETTNATDWEKVFADELGAKMIPADILPMIKTTADKEYAALYYFFTDAMKTRYLQYDENHGIMSRGEYSPESIEELFKGKATGDDDDEDEDDDIPNEIFLTKAQYQIEYAKLDIIVEDLQKKMMPLQVKYAIDGKYGPLPNLNDEHGLDSTKKLEELIKDCVQLHAFDKLIDEAKVIRALLVVLQKEMRFHLWQPSSPGVQKQWFDVVVIDQMKLGLKPSEVMKNLDQAVTAASDPNVMNLKGQELVYAVRWLLHGVRVEKDKQTANNYLKMLSLPEQKPDYPPFLIRDGVPPKVLATRTQLYKEYVEARKDFGIACKKLKKQCQVIEDALRTEDLHPTESPLKVADRTKRLERVRSTLMHFDQLRMKELILQYNYDDYQSSLINLRLVSQHPEESWSFIDATIEELRQKQRLSAEELATARQEYESFVPSLKDYDGYKLPEKGLFEVEIGVRTEEEKKRDEL